MENRIFNFRAYHLTAKEMIYETNQGDVFNWLKEKQPIIIMHSIGQKDVNGKEIFEGDIVIHAGWTCEVKWQIGKACFSLVCTDGLTDTTVISNTIAEKFIEVIGNIYENKDAHFIPLSKHNKA